ncbi:hypothetical protein HMPREF3190_01402 [Umbribacter vaginalis]|nr:hypothetical protein HMPREF3190_01402 [Coriobacteriales bacterium DNF00809]
MYLYSYTKKRYQKVARGAFLTKTMHLKNFVLIAICGGKTARKLIVLEATKRAQKCAMNSVLPRRSKM